jgi:hypothetical protein
MMRPAATEQEQFSSKLKAVSVRGLFELGQFNREKIMYAALETEYMRSASISAQDLERQGHFANCNCKSTAPNCSRSKELTKVQLGSSWNEIVTRCIWDHAARVQQKEFQKPGKLGALADEGITRRYRLRLLEKKTTKKFQIKLFSALCAQSGRRRFQGHVAD